eukprot:258911_1
MMEIDKSLPSKWNVITKNARNRNDPWSNERFGTMNMGARVKPNNNHSSATVSNLKVHDCPNCQCSNETDNKTNNNYNSSQNNFSSSNTFNWNVQPFNTNTNTNTNIYPINNINNDFDDSDDETLASNDSQRSEESWSMHSSDIEAINDNNITQKDVSESSDNISNTESDHSDDIGLSNHNIVNAMSNIPQMTPHTSHNEYVLENYNYTDWIDDSNENDNIFENDEFYEVITEKDIENDKKAEEQNEEYNNRTDLNEEDRNWKFKGHIALRQIRRYQKGYGLLISKEEFISEIGNIIYNIQNSMNPMDSIPIDISIIHPLQESVEAYLIELFEDAQLFASHAQRESVNETDIKMVLKLHQNQMENFKWLNMIVEKYVG